MLRTNKDTLYTGITTDLSRRIRQHNGEIKGGAKALRGKGPVELVGLWQADSQTQALQCEAHIKRFTRVQKNQLIKGDKEISEVNVQKIPLPVLPTQD